MRAKLCSYRKTDGLQCRAVAIAGSRLCLAHKRLDQRSRRQQRYQRTPAIRLGPLADRSSIQRALTRVAQAIASGSLPLERCAAHLQRLRLASDSLADREGLPACEPHPVLGIESLRICPPTPATLQSTKPSARESPRSPQPERQR